MRVYSAPNITMVGHFKNLLEMNGISSEIRGDKRSIGAGEIPPIECWIELWVTEDSQIENAKQIIKEALESAENESENWQCPGCGEDIEGQFSDCWNCGKSRYKNGENQ